MRYYESFKGLDWSDYNRVYDNIRANWDRVAKPLDGLGDFEDITARIGAVLGSEHIDVSRKAVIVMCSDNGIVAEGVSQTGQEVTLSVAKAMGQGLSTVCRMAKATGVDVVPVDVGINCTEAIPGVIDKKVRAGSRNFHRERAMTAEETKEAIEVGVSCVKELVDKGYRLIATGELGIGNTTTSSAVAAALLKLSASEVTGRGAGLSDEGLIRKISMIDEAIEQFGLYEADVMTVLASVGGFDIAALAGVCIGGAIYRVPVVLDGVISLVAALVASRLMPGVQRVYIGSHSGREPAIKRLLDELGIRSCITGNMALGEGTGAVMMMSLIDVALSVYEDRVTFEDMDIVQYERFDK